MPSTAPWTPALEPALLATCALHALLSVVLLRPATPLTVYQHSSRIPCEDLGLILVPPQMPSTALWTPALETALLAICALLALLFVVLLRPVTPPTPLALFLCIMSLQLSLHARDLTAISPAVWTHALVLAAHSPCSLHLSMALSPREPYLTHPRPPSYTTV